MIKESRQSYDYRAGYLKRSPSICGYFICSICGKLVTKRYLHVDHILPLARGGKNRWLNTVATCSTCNQNKSSNITRVLLFKGIMCKGIEIIIISIKLLVSYFFYLSYNSIRGILIILLLPLKSNIHWIFKLSYLVLLLKMGGV